MRLLLLVSLFLLSTLSIAAQGTARLYDTLNKTILMLDEGKVIDSSGKVLFTVRGNLIFGGESYENEDIRYLVKSRDIFSKGQGFIYDRKMEHVLFSVHKGNLYVGENRYSEYRLLSIEKLSEKVYHIYQGRSDRLLAKIISTDIKNTELIGFLLGLLDYFDLEKGVEDKLSVREYALGEGIKGIIRPYTGSDYYYEWIWDGHVLRPRYGHRPEDEWTFDGEFIRPYWGVADQQEWYWDGQVLKPYWENLPGLQFYWDEHTHTLRPYWEYTKEDEWKIEDGRAWPKWTHELNREWVIEGDIPVPLIAMIIMGFADR